jgi:hypothetical protein
MGCELVLFGGRPCDSPGLCCEHVSVCVVVPLRLPVLVSRDAWEVMVVSQVEPLARWLGRAVGLDCDRVVMEVSGSAWEVARRLEGHVNRVVVSPDDTGIAQARTKTDKLDARTLAYLLWKGQIDTCAATCGP